MEILHIPEGKAREYAELSLNIYKGCTHGCTYCYCPRVLHKTKDGYFDGEDAKTDVKGKLTRDCLRLNGHTPEILLSFAGDVYQPAEMDLQLTRPAIEILKDHNLRFTILTKGGTRAVRDFDLLQGYGKARFGTSLVFTEQETADIWEPGAAPILDRVQAIQEAYDRQIDTWISLEPVIDPGQALQVIRTLHPIVKHWKVGKLNHNKDVEKKVNWSTFYSDVVGLLDSVKANYYIKTSLTAYA